VNQRCFGGEARVETGTRADYFIARVFEIKQREIFFSKSRFGLALAAIRIGTPTA
jgi:hypothetical protein